VSFDDFDYLFTQSLSFDEQIDCLHRLPLSDLDSEVLVRYVNIARSHANLLPLLVEDAVDLVGTGGDGYNTFNISTTASFVAAAAGTPIAKSGNRAASSQSGSYDVLQALGFPVFEKASQVNAQLKKFGITFMFAPYFHRAFKRFSAARKAYGKKTVFNVLGPLLNPMQVKRHALGVFSPELIKPYIETLQKLASKKAIVVHGDGLDEFSLSGENQVAMLQSGRISYQTMRASDFGLSSCTLSALVGGGANENATMTLAILSGEATAAKKDIVIFNAAAAIWAGDDQINDFAEAVLCARKAIDSGAALALLKEARGE
jgi:anthranilate phosphoribosyltransferase